MLVTSGFGSYRRADATPYPAAATMDVIRGRTGAAATTATLFPGDNSTLPIPQQSYHGGESPDPLSSCPGYNPGTGPINTGTPLFALLPNAPDVASTTTATLERNGVAVESCVYDENSYTNADSDGRRPRAAGARQPPSGRRDPARPRWCRAPTTTCPSAPRTSAT